MALIALLVLVLGASIWALLNDKAPEPVEPSSSAVPTASKPPSPSTTPSSDLIDVAALKLEGLTCDAAAQIVGEAKLSSTCQAGNPAETPEQIGTIYEVSPRGFVPEGSTLTLLTYGEQTAIGSPDSAPWVTAAGATLTEVVAGSTVQLNWKGFSCPPGTGAVGSYTVTMTGGTFTDGSTTRSFGASERSTQVVVTNLVGQRFVATYFASCNRDSGASPELNVPITAPVVPEPPKTEEE